MNRSSRPVGITALIIFFIGGALLSFLAGLSLLFPDGALNQMWRLNPHGHDRLLRMGIWSILLLFAASSACAATAVGLWKRARWGYILAIVLIGIYMVSGMVFTVLRIEPSAFVGVPIALFIILYLLTNRVRTYFAKRGAGPLYPEQ
jgi:hypothetical protein